MSGCAATDEVIRIFLTSMPHLVRVEAHFTRLTQDCIAYTRDFRPTLVINKVEPLIVQVQPIEEVAAN